MELVFAAGGDDSSDDALKEEMMVKVKDGKFGHKTTCRMIKQQKIINYRDFTLQTGSAG